MHSLYIKVEHVTKCDVTQLESGIRDSTIAAAMSALPLDYPEMVGYSIQHRARVSDGVDVNLNLLDFLSTSPLTITYNIPEPLSATPPADSDVVSMVRNLQAEVRDLRGAVTAVQVEVEVQKATIEVQKATIDRLLDSTRIILPVILRIVLDAHLMQLGFLSSHKPRSRFIAENSAGLAAATGVVQNKVVSFFGRYHDQGNLSAHNTTSLSVAHAIIYSDLHPSDQLMWRTIFQHTFQRSVEEQFNEGRETVWFVDAGTDCGSVSSRFTFVDRSGQGPIRPWELNQ